MDTLTTVLDSPATTSGSPSEPAATTSNPVPTAIAYLLDADSVGVVNQCFADLGFIDRDVLTGNIDTAIEQLPRRGWPRFLIVDVSGIGDPLPRINRLAEVCSLETEVIVVGERNDIVLYRALKAAGVAEYFFKPLIANLVGRVLDGIGGGKNLQPSRSGMLIFVVGVRGGVGVTTIATSLAWYFAEIRQRGVLLLDLDLHAGDAALQLDAKPSHALREALEDPKRIDELFLERGVAPVTERLGLLAGIEPLSDRVVLNEDTVTQLLHKILAHYRYVLVDLPGEIALRFPKILHMPSALLLVSDGSIASIREVARWREFIGPNTPERRLLHILNKKDGPGALPEREMLRIIPPPEVSIRSDHQIVSVAALGTKLVQRRRAIRDGMTALSLQLSGAAADPPQSLWKRIFG